MTQTNRKPLSHAISMAMSGTTLAAMAVCPVQAAEDLVLEEVTVTAQKRTENLQDVALSIQVMDNQQLENLQIKGLDDYFLYTPTVSYTSAGPGYGQIYMRGIVSGGDGVHSGSMPSVGIYLDEQPITTINQVLNVHVYDIARIEALSGPQGTLYGQGSQSGTIRIITNKPVIGEHLSGYDVYANWTKSGDPGYGLEGFINIPINDRVAVRLVAWHEKLGGYINNVPGEITFASSDIRIDNASTVEENYNSASTTGVRGLLKIDLDENWTLTPGIMYQTSDVDGRWAHNPDYIGDLEVRTFFPEFNDEDWYQASLTLEGSIGDLDLVYAGAYFDRDVETSYDYSGYAEYLEDLYSNYGYYCLYYDPLGDCANPAQYVAGDENFNRYSHELRLQSATDQRLRWIAGLFYQRQEHLFDLQWVVPDMNPLDSVVQNGVTTWQTNQKRVDKEGAIFGEVYFDITDNFTLMGGMRWFDYDNSLYGFNGFLRDCTGFYDSDDNFVQDNGGEPQFPCYNTGILNDAQGGNDVAWKGNLEYRIDDSKMVYLTYSEGFRAGGVNRARVPGIPNYEPDWVYNYEFGWKTTWADGRFRFNGAAYIVDWDDFQFDFLDFTVSNLTIIQNVGKARTKGIEWDMDFAATEDLTLSFAGSYNDAKLQQDFWRIDTDEGEGLPPTSPKGTAMPYVPKLQLTGIARFNFDIGSLPAFGQVAISYRDKSWNSLDVEVRQQMGSYTVFNLSTGIEKDNWQLMLYLNNATDERGQIDILDPGYFSPSGIDYNQNIIRPRSFGIRWSQRF